MFLRVLGNVNASIGVCIITRRLFSPLQTTTTLTDGEVLLRLRVVFSETIECG